MGGDVVSRCEAPCPGWGVVDELARPLNKSGGQLIKRGKRARAPAGDRGERTGFFPATNAFFIGPEVGPGGEERHDWRLAHCRPPLAHEHAPHSPPPPRGHVPGCNSISTGLLRQHKHFSGGEKTRVHRWRPLIPPHATPTPPGVRHAFIDLT